MNPIHDKPPYIPFAHCSFVPAPFGFVAPPTSEQADAVRDSERVSTRTSRVDEYDFFATKAAA